MFDIIRHNDDNSLAGGIIAARDGLRCWIGLFIDPVKNTLFHFSFPFCPRDLRGGLSVQVFSFDDDSIARFNRVINRQSLQKLNRVFVESVHCYTVHIVIKLSWGDFMPLAESKRRANNKWDAANMTVLGCKIRKDKAEEFKAACKAAGTTPNAVFTAAINEFMQRDKTGAGE